MNFQLFIAEPEDFKEVKELGENINSKTKPVFQKDTKFLYAMKIFEDNNIISSIKDEIDSNCEIISQKMYPFHLPPSYISYKNNENIMIYTDYKKKGSLYSIIKQQMNGATIQNYDIGQEYLILYGISCFLESFHSDDKVHGGIKLTNVLLDDDFNPCITESCLFGVISEKQFSNTTNDLIVSVPPEILNDKKPTKESDIYSFGILILQVLKHEINVFSEHSENVDSIEELIQKNIQPIIPKDIPTQLSEILESCFSDDPDQRPYASDLKDVFEKILNEESYKKRFDSFKNKNEEAQAMMQDLELNNNDEDLMKMFLYGMQLYENQKEREGIKYIRFAARKGLYDAQNFYKSVRKDNSQYSHQLNIKDSYENKTHKIIIHLRDDNSFEQNEFDFKQLMEKVLDYLNHNEEFKDQKLLKRKFIFTKEAKKRLITLKKYIDVGIPVILEGPTGTSKTVSVEIICELLGRELIRINLSSETKLNDFLGRYVGDSSSWALIKMIQGPFIDAFKNGKTLLLDEINLGNPQCLQFIEEILDSGMISIETQGNPLEVIKMHPEFRLVATQNPNKGLYFHKRQSLGNKFKSRFQFIHFPELTEELLDIAIGLADEYNYQSKNKDQIIRDLIKFHLKLVSNVFKEDNLCFTIREIADAIKALAANKNIYDTIMTIYGARYQKEKREILQEEFRKYPSFKDCKPEDFEYPKDFPKCFKNPSLSNALKSILFSFENHHHVMLVGAKGSGLSQIARWISQWYQQTNKDKRQAYFGICTEETKCSDLIGKYKLTDNLRSRNDNDEILLWKNGFLTEAVYFGYVAVLDKIEEALALVTERINGLLDKKYEEGMDQSNFIFEIPENQSQRYIHIHENFRLLCICNIDKLDQISPAFLNRFDLVVLEDQINENNLKSLIVHQIEHFNCTSTSPLKQKDIDYLHTKIQSINTSDTKITMLTISQICKAVMKYKDFFKNKIDDNTIIDFALNMLDKKKDFKIPEQIEEYLLKDLSAHKKYNDDQFFYEHSPNLKSIMAKIYAASLINLPVCLQGPTGVGKTSLAIEFARNRPATIDLNETYLMLTFHAGTKSKDLYGTKTINNEQILFINGPLTTAMIKGLTFIADEMNLSPNQTMKSIAPALEITNEEPLFISDVDEQITVNQNFFFIACQNEIGTNGRNANPECIDSRFRYFYFPQHEENDILPICRDIVNSLYKNKKIQSFTDEDSENVGKYMLKINQIEQGIIPKWSLRDVRKIFLRIYHQDTNKEDFKEMTVCKNILFYTLSSVNNEDVNDILETVVDLISQIFNCQKDELMTCYKSEPVIINNFLMKGNCGVSVSSFKNIEVFSKLPSLLDAMFKILLSHPTEPIILLGQSGCKTFVAEQFLKNAKTITLNLESTVEQLIGLSEYFTKEEAKIFYIEMICKLCHISDKIPEYIEQYKNKTLTKESFTNKDNTSFSYAINHLIDKLFDDNQSNDSIIPDIEIEFRPGLILSAIIECKPLILKNISNIPSKVLERFNQFFSGKPNLTLNEDIHKTFTNETEKELHDINTNSRVFGTCQSNSIHKLSEPLQSRFTVIFVSEYKIEEQETVLKNYIESNNLCFNESLVLNLTKFTEKMKSKLGKEYTFSQMINFVEMCSRLNKNTDENNWKQNMGIILYRLGNGLLEKRKKTKDVLYDIFKELEIPLPQNMKSSTEENPLILSQTEKGYKCLKSNISNILHISPDVKENETNLAFTPMFSEMLDVLLLGIKINIPVILEGMPGQGKKTAINYISNMLGYQVINIIISQTTKVDDLFGKLAIVRDKKNKIKIEHIETKLIKVLKSNLNEKNKSIIVFHNINNASSAVLEVLASIFDQHQKDILLTNGSTIMKGDIKIVGIFNSQDGIFNRDKIHSSMIYSSIYHIVNNPNEKELLSVIGSQFKNTKFGVDEVKNFYHNFTKIKKLSKEANVPLTLNDIVKYKKYRMITYEKFNSAIISSMQFAYRFLHNDTIQEALKLIGTMDMKFIPDFEFNFDTNKLLIKESKDSKNCISLDFNSKNVDFSSIKSEIASLTLPEKRCLLFLAISVLSGQACIIKGETASGKSHVIQLFAKMLGKKLIVYQLNNEAGISILTGQSILSNNLSDEDINDINSALTDLEKIPSIEEYISKNISKIPKEWTRSMFTELIKEISSEKYSNNNEIKEIIEPAKQKISETIQPAKRFHIADSSFIRAMREGEFVLFDGIESAKPEIIERLISLLGENPYIDLYERGDGFYFTSKQINKGFHLFFTYNPTSQVENKTFDPNFLNNCATFTLPSIDSTPENIAQRIVGTLIQHYPEKLSIEIAKRFAKMHSFGKEVSQKDEESMAGSIEFTIRNINNVVKEFMHHKNVSENPVEQIFMPICNSMKYYYFNSYINAEKEEEFKKNMINEFCKDIDPKEFTNLEYEGINLNSKYKEILIDLRNIQICENVKEKTYIFNFPNFVNNCIQFIKINDIDFILDHINDTLDIISQSKKDFTKEFSQLKIISNLLEDIKEGKKNLNDYGVMKLDDEDLLKTEQLKTPLLKLKLLSKLTNLDDKSMELFTLNIPKFFYDSNFVSLMNTILIMQKENSLENFKLFILNLNLYQKFIPLIESRFPYNMFEKTKFKMIHYILPMIKILHESKNNFTIEVLNEKFPFLYEDHPLLEINYIIIEINNELSLSIESKLDFTVNIDCDFSKKMPNKYQFKDTESINSFYFNLTKNIIENFTRILELDNYNSFIDKSNPKENQISQLSLLLSNDLKSLTSNIWPIVYSFRQNDIKVFSEYLLPLEKDLLISILGIYNNISKFDIDAIFNFSIWLSNFHIKNSCLWEIENNEFKIDPNVDYNGANIKLEKLKKEIKDLKYASQLLSKEIWPFEKYINLLQQSQNKVKSKIQELILQNKNLKLLNDLKQILDKLNQVSENESLKNQIYEEIMKDSEQNLTDDTINFYRNQVDNFIDSIKKKDKYYPKNTICWPTYKSTKEISRYDPKNLELYQIIIWYSTIKRIFNKIKNVNSQNVFQYIMELNEFKEMKDVVTLLTNRFLHVENSTKGLNQEDISIINGILNAQFLYKFIKNNQINKINELHSMLNDLENRNIIDEKILFWIHNIANQYTPDFCLSTPVFQPKDLIYLFIGYNENATNNNNTGPLLQKLYSNKNKDDLFVKNLQEQLSKEFKNFVDCSLIIVQNLYKVYIDEKKELPNDYQKMKDILYESKSNCYIKSALSIMKIAKKIDSQKIIGFTFNDTFFLEENWILKEELTNKYPYLVFWLCKNHFCVDKLKDIYRNPKFSKDELPFWLFVLRLMSSENRLSFDSQSTIVSDFINQVIQKQIRYRLKNNKYIGTKWLNLLLPSLPSEIYIPKYHMFYQFFQNLSKDTKSLQKQTLDIKKEQINKFIDEIFNCIFENQDEKNSVLNLPIYSNNNIMKFIRNPNELVGNEINKRMQTVFNNFINSSELNNFMQFISTFKDTVNGLINTFRQNIREAKISKMKDDITRCIREYNKQFKKISSQEPIENFYDLQKSCNSLMNYLHNIKYLPNCFDKIPFELDQFMEKKYSWYPNYRKIQLNKDETIHLYYNTPYFFYQEDSDGIKHLLSSKHNSADKIRWTKLKIFPINDAFNVDKFCNENYKESQALTFYCKSKYTYKYKFLNFEQLISKVDNTSNDSLDFANNLQKDINMSFKLFYQKNLHSTLKNLDILQNEIKSLISYFNVDNHDDSEIINMFLKNMLNTFNQLVSHINIINFNLTNIDGMWNIYHFEPVFNEGYELPIPEYCLLNSSENHFKNIKNTNLISNPILSIDNNSIVCCYDSINCELGPFIPSLYSKKFAINFISFIDTSFTVKLETDPKYSDLFSSKYNFSKGESVQIFFSLPNIITETQKSKTHIISTKIIFESEKLQKLILPCNFSIKTVPLSFLISCKQSQLSFDNAKFYVCKDILSPFSRLTFSINNCYIKEKINVLHQLISLEGNTITKPEIYESFDRLELIIPNINSVERIHAEIILKFSNALSTSIVIDAKVFPFDFEFEVYDPNEKQFVKNATIFYSNAYIDHKINLHFRILCPKLADEFIAEIQDNFSKKINAHYSINELDLNNRKFKIKNNKEFDIILNISSYIKSYRYGKDPSFELSLLVNGKKEYITLKLSPFNNQIFNSLNSYAYDSFENNWYPFDKKDKHDRYSCVVTPFSCTLKQIKISYLIVCTVDDDQNKFILINEDGEKVSKNSKFANIERRDGFFVRTIKKIANKNSDFYPIFGLYENEWYPVFDAYPEIRWEMLEITESNIDIAQKDIENIKKIYENVMSLTHFYNFIKLLLSPKVIKNMKELIQSFPIEIRNNFDQILLNAEKIDIKSSQMIIISHNAIILFNNLFNERYKEIKKNNMSILLCPLKQEEIDKKVGECYEEYSQIDSKTKIESNKRYQKYNELDLAVENMQLDSKPENKSDVFLYTEKSSPIPVDTSYKPENVDCCQTYISESKIKNIEFELPPIRIPKTEKINSLTIQELNDVYLSGIKGARLLPIYVSKMKSSQSKTMEKEAGVYFSTLLQLYNNLPIIDYSFISMTTNLFIESFSLMIIKFKKAGVDLTKLLKHKISDEKLQDFLQIPNKDEFSIPPDQWIINKKNKSDQIYDPSEQNPIFIPEPNPNTKHNQQYSEDEIKTNNNDKNPSEISPEKRSTDDEMNQKLNDLIRIMTDEHQDDISDDPIAVINNQNEDEDGTPTNVFVASEDNIKDKTISNNDFKEINSEFTEENGINRAVSRMNNMKNKTKLIIQEWELPDINPAFLKTEKEDFPINELIPHGFYLANKFIKEASEMNISKYKFSVNILADCSNFISDENKIFNMMIICGLTTALESLEIPYSVAVIAEKNFKCVIKTFDEPHSSKCLQKILDCLLIKRYRTKLATSIKFAIEAMSYPCNDESKENERPYRAIFTFSDGLDEQLVLTNAWSNSILSEKNLSFGFIFIKSSKLLGNNLEVVENVWKDFEKETNKNKQIPNVSVASIKAKLDDDLSDKLCHLFRTVMKRNIFNDLNHLNESKKDKITYAEATFSIDKKLSNIKRFSNFISSDYHSMKEVYTKSTQVLKKANSTIDKLNLLTYHNKLHKIANCELNTNITKKQCSDFVKSYLINKRSINQASLETIFKPNKASQTVLSTTGTDFDITALVLNLINPVPDPMIYLEEKGGLIRNYGISIVVDSSISCFDELSGPHSFKTLQMILSSLAALDISCFDLIVSGNPQPIVLCSEVSTIQSLSSKSPLFNSLLAILQNPIHDSDLGSAIHTAFDLRRMRISEHANILFVLTNGLYDNKECERIINSVNICVQRGITTFGIGIGNYPKKIEKLFPHVIYSLNPQNVMKAIASFHGDSLPSVLDTMKPINFVPKKSEELDNLIKKLIEKEKTPIFNSLTDSLDNIMVTLDAFDDMYNEEQLINDDTNGYMNPTGENTELYVQNLLQGQKILIVMLWDRSLNKNEEFYVHEDYINKPSEEGAGCIKTAVDYYGIELTIVKNYEDAIIELTKQTKPGYCDYYATWVFCGPPLEILPQQENNNADPNLVGQFNEVLIKFWKNGGSIVFWAEGDPLHYQVNLFLQTADFGDECSTGKTSLRIGGTHTGEKTLIGEESDSLEHPTTFNRKKRKYGKMQRSILSHNLIKIFEGISISYAQYNLNNIKPFIPFARDSEGGISSLFYEANKKKGTGDIVIDCGYSKCFTQMKTDGTFKYIRNIAGWTARPEIHKKYDRVEPKDWRPKAVEHEIQKGVIWPYFQIEEVNPLELKTIWAIDASDSIRGAPFYHSELQKIFDKYNKTNGEFYLWSDEIEQIAQAQLQQFITKKDARKKGTRSSLIAQIAKNSKIRDHLLIVTDGSVDFGEIEKSDQIMEENNIRFKYVTTFIIQDEYDSITRENLNDPNTRNQIKPETLNEIKIIPDLSVGASYVRRCQNTTYYIKESGATPIEMASLKSDDLNTYNEIDNILDYNTFIELFEKLVKVIQLSSIGKPENPELLKKLEELKSRVIKTGMNSQQEKDFDKKIQILIQIANGSLKGKFKLTDIVVATNDPKV